jgi:hypothetical protein
VVLPLVIAYDASGWFDEKCDGIEDDEVAERGFGVMHEHAELGEMLQQREKFFFEREIWN